jgi:CelD/BcsL family acetyltransferase involved in cellulose biosynthesis
MRTPAISTINQRANVNDAPTRASLRASVGAPMRARSLAAQELSAQDIAAWSALESRALEHNAYLSPHFVFPALRHLDPHLPVQILVIERAAPGCVQWVGLGVFQLSARSSTFPMAHLAAYRSEHSFASGVLLDREHAKDALLAMLAHVRALPGNVHGIDFGHTWADGAQAELMRGAFAEESLTISVYKTVERSVLDCQSIGDAALAAIAPNKRQDLERRAKRLRGRGSVTWATECAAQQVPRCTEDFLELEAARWRGRQGSALRDCPRGAAFFRECMAGFASEGRALFTELRLDGKLIATTSNVISGNTGFAFKIGWDLAYKNFSPGWLNELEFLRQPSPATAGLTHFDSGASPGSYIDDLWPGRRTMAGTAVALTQVGGAALSTLDTARAFKRGGWVCIGPALYDAGAALAAIV